MSQCRGQLLPTGVVFLVFTLLSGHASAQDPAANVIDALAGLKTQLNTVNSTADLTCESSRMVVNLTFASPFFGRIFAENDPLDPECRKLDPPIPGLRNYRYYIPLKKCGTKQISLREFENTLQIRFNKNSKDIELGDERKTILCRYPPPVVPPVVPIPPPIPAAIPPAPAATVSELELLLIIAAVLFLGLLLLGLCCAWWCCKRRRAQKVVESEGVLIEAPEVMKLSGTTMPFLDSIRIPRATASQAGSDVSESALIQRLEESGSGSGEIFPIVPAETERLRIPHVTQLSKGYELQEASMTVPAPSLPPTETTQAESEANVTTLDQDVEHTAIFSKIPEQPQALLPPIPGPSQMNEYDRETASDITENEMEYTLIAGRIPPRPPSPVRSEGLLEVRSVTEMSEGSLTRQYVVPRPQPVLPPKPKMVTAEVEIETHSVVESLENELILRAVPKRQLQLPPAQPYYPLQTTTETTVVSEQEERQYPPLSRPVIKRPRPGSAYTESEQRTDTQDLRRNYVPPTPPSTTTRTVKETNIIREFDVFPDQPGPRQPRDLIVREDVVSRNFERVPRGPDIPSTVTKTTKETDIRREMEIYPPGPPAPNYSVTDRTDRLSERSPVRPGQFTKSTTETDIRRDFEIIRDQPMEPQIYRPESQTTTRTTRETDIRRDFEISGQPQFRRPEPVTTTTFDRREEVVRYPGPVQPVATDRTVIERNIRQESQLYSPVRPSTTVTRFMDRHFETGQSPYEPAGTRTTSRLQRETLITREYDTSGSPPRDVSLSPDYPVEGETTTRRTETHRFFPEESQTPSRRVSPPTGRDTYLNTLTREVQRELDIGTPPKRSPPGSEIAQPTARTATTDFRSDVTAAVSTLIPRPVFRGSSQATTNSSAGRSSRLPDMPNYPQAQPTFSPFTQTFTLSEGYNAPRIPVSWLDIQYALDQLPYAPGTRYEIPELAFSDVRTLHYLMLNDQEFQLKITLVRSVYDLYSIRYTPPYETYFTSVSWVIIIHIFIRVLDLPPPHPGDSDFIEPRPEWFSRTDTLTRESSEEDSSSTVTPSYNERALSELTEEIPRMVRRDYDGSERGSSWFGSATRRGSGYSGVEERSVSEHYEDIPTVSFGLTYKNHQEERQVASVLREADEESASEL